MVVAPYQELFDSVLHTFSPKKQVIVCREDHDCYGQYQFYIYASVLTFLTLFHKKSYRYYQDKLLFLPSFSIFFLDDVDGNSIYLLYQNNSFHTKKFFSDQFQVHHKNP